jgi:hypothetical protein
MKPEWLEYQRHLNPISIQLIIHNTGLLFLQLPCPQTLGKI